MNDHDDETIPPRLRSAMRAATGTPRMDAASDRALRTAIRSHPGFATRAASGAAFGSRPGRRWWLRAALIATPFAAAAVLALWLSGVAGVLFKSERRAAPMVAAVPEPTRHPTSNEIARDLAAAVWLARSADSKNAANPGASPSIASHAPIPPTVAAMLAAIVASAPAVGDPREPGARFMAFDLFVNAPRTVDGVVLDLKIDDPRGVIVGIESGDAPFTEPATYDPERLARGEVRLAAIAARPADGRVRVATISLLCEHDDPGLTLTPVSAVAHDNAAPSTNPPADRETIVVPVTWAIEPRSRS